jgi:hypothetical protein
MLTLAGNWQVTEFNIFGDSFGSQAVFQGAPTIVARTGLNDGTTKKPVCLAQSFTGETNNLSFGPGGLVTATVAGREGGRTDRLSCCCYGILPLRRRFGPEGPQRGP